MRHRDDTAELVVDHLRAAIGVYDAGKYEQLIDDTLLLQQGNPGCRTHKE